MEQDGKQRLMEVMGRLDKTFKPKLNESQYTVTDPTKEEMVNFLTQKFHGLVDPAETDANNFDVAAAIYWFANDYHGGQSSNLYSALSTSDYRPGPMHKSIEDDESETATMMYQELVDKYGGGAQDEPEVDKSQWMGMSMNEKDDNWIQKAVDPAHKGDCTPMTKDTCTPARKAFAKRAKAGDLEEDMCVDVKVGDTIKTGRFKNSPTVVKSIGKDENGMPTINGKKAVTFKKGIEKESVQEEIRYPSPEEYKGKVEQIKKTMDMLFNDEYFDVIDTLFRLLVTRDSGKIGSLAEGIDGMSVGHNVYKDVMTLINHAGGDDIWANGAEGALNFYEEVLKGISDALYQDMGDSVNPNAGAAPDEVVEADAFNDAGEPNMTHSQFRDHSEPAEPEYDDNQPPQQPQGMGDFKHVDWRAVHEILVHNTDLFKQGNINQSTTVNDLTDYDGYLSPEELKHLDNHSLVYIDAQNVVIDDDQYLDYDTFFNKAQEVWDKEADIQSSGNNDSEAPYMRGYEPMSENVTEKRLMDMMNKINPISKII